MALAARVAESGPARCPAKGSVRMQVVDAELVDFPPCAFFKIAVERTGFENRRHHVTKCFADLQLLHELLKQELQMSFLPAPPHARSVAESDSLQYRMLLNVHLSTLVRDALVLSSQLFCDFFQLSEEYQQTCLGRPTGAGAHRELAPLSTVCLVIERSGPLAQIVSKPATPRSGALPEGDAFLAPHCLPRPTGAFDGGLEMHGRKSLDTHCARSNSSDGSTRCSTPCQVANETSAGASTPSQEIRSPSPGSSALDTQTLVFSQHLSCRRLLEAVETAQPQQEHASLVAGRPPHEEPAAETGALWASVCGSECVVCMERPQEVAIIPCGHLSMCHVCAPAMSECPVCRGRVDRILRIYTA